MHIAVLCDPASFHTQKWSEALQRNGAQVTVFSFSREQIPGIPCVQVEPAFTRRGQLTYASFLYSGRRLKAALEQHKVDVVNPINITPYGVWAARSGFRPIAAIAMGADILEYPPRPEDSPYALWNDVDRPHAQGKLIGRLKYYFFRYHVQKALDASGFITGDNLVLVKAMRDWFGVPAAKLRLNRWGVEEELFRTTEAEKEALRKKYGISPGQKVVLSPRGMKPIYQGEVILEAFARLLEDAQRPEKFLMLSAGYEVPGAVRQRAFGLMERYPNFFYQEEVLPRREVIQLWSLVDLFISAPLYDGYSNAVAEGRYAGAIPVVNAIPGNEEILSHDHNGWFVDPFTPEKLSRELLHLLEHLEAYREKFRKVNREWILAHSLLDRNVQDFLAACERLVR